MSASELINSINAVISGDVELQDEERGQLLAACEKMQVKLENPLQKMYRIIFSPYQIISLQIAVDMEFFDAAAEATAQGRDITLEVLAAKKNADTVLVARIMRFMVGVGFFNEVGVGRFTPLPMAKMMVSSSLAAQGFPQLVSQNSVAMKLPEYLAKTNYKNPDDAYNSPFQYARNTKLHNFDWLGTQPHLQKSFNALMSIPRGNPNEQQWFDFFPVSTKMQVSSSSSPLLVDVGGGVGHHVILFQNAHPTVQGKLIVQDLPQVVNSITNLPLGIEAQPHDFFKEQPVKGARAYYLSHVLHDWPDKQASIILARVVEAMDKESMVLVHENVLPETGVSLFNASADFLMMTSFAALERTELQWRSLFDSVGLVVRGVWMSEDARLGKGEYKGKRLFELVKV